VDWKETKQEARKPNSKVLRQGIKEIQINAEMVGIERY
jgi:hypothetical protein